MIANFGKNFTYSLYPLSSEGSAYLFFSPSAPTIHVFADYPTETQAVSGSGAIETITTWNSTPDGKGKQFDVTAIPVPTDLGTNQTRTYYIAVNAELQSGETLAPLIRSVILEQLRAQESILRIDVTDVVAREPAVQVFTKCIGDLDLYIDAAVMDLKLYLSNCNLKYTDINNPGAFKPAAVCLALSKFFYGQSRQAGDVHAVNGARFAAEYKEKMAVVKASIDADNDGREDGVRTGPRGSMRVMRLSR